MKAIYVMLFVVLAAVVLEAKTAKKRSDEILQGIKILKSYRLPAKVDYSF